MRIAARWAGVGSIVVGALGAFALAVLLYPSPPEKLSAELSWREYTYVELRMGDRRDVDAAQACLDQHSGWIEIDRDQHGRATVVSVDEQATGLSRCMRDAYAQGCFLSRSYRRPGPWAFFHERVIDSWAAPTEPPLLP